MEAWQKAHSELYDENGKPREAFYQIPDAPRTHPRFRLIRVSERVEEYVMALEAAAKRLAKAETGEEINNAYSALCMARKALYTYIEGLETAAGKVRTVAKRFD